MICSGPTEGTNNKIKTMKRGAYEFRDLGFFRLKILAIHEASYALVGRFVGSDGSKLGERLEPEPLARRTISDSWHRGWQ
jgi:hypothetical protein